MSISRLQRSSAGVGSRPKLPVRDDCNVYYNCHSQPTCVTNLRSAEQLFTAVAYTSFLQRHNIIKPPSRCESETICYTI